LTLRTATSTLLSILPCLTAKILAHTQKMFSFASIEISGLVSAVFYENPVEFFELRLEFLHLKPGIPEIFYDGFETGINHNRRKPLRSPGIYPVCMGLISNSMQKTISSCVIPQ